MSPLLLILYPILLLILPSACVLYLLSMLYRAVLCDDRKQIEISLLAVQLKQHQICVDVHEVRYVCIRFLLTCPTLKFKLVPRELSQAGSEGTLKLVPRELLNWFRGNLKRLVPKELFTGSKGTLNLVPRELLNRFRGTLKSVSILAVAVDGAPHWSKIKQ